MKYIICISGLHQKIAKSIQEESRGEEIKILYLPKEATLGKKIKETIIAISTAAKCLIDNDSHAIVAHPFNIWFSTFIATARKISFYDDGIAYYYDASLPTGLFSKAYKIIIKSKRLLKQAPANDTYIEFIKNCKYEKFYCLFPELLKTIPNKHKLKIKNKPYSPENGITLYVDSTPKVSSHLHIRKIISTLEIAANRSAEKKIYFKAHPSQETKTIDLLRQKKWAVETNENIENLIENHPIHSIYSIFSSATISAHLISPTTRLYCFTSASIEKELFKIINLYKRLNVKFISAEKH